MENKDKNWESMMKSDLAYFYLESAFQVMIAENFPKLTKNIISWIQEIMQILSKSLSRNSYLNNS